MLDFHGLSTSKIAQKKGEEKNRRLCRPRLQSDLGVIHLDEALNKWFWDAERQPFHAVSTYFNQPMQLSFSKPNARSHFLNYGANWVSSASELLDISRHVKTHKVTSSNGQILNQGRRSTELAEEEDVRENAWSSPNHAFL